LADSLQAAAPSKHWKGAITRTGASWSLASNWQENIPPADGDDLIFPSTASTFTLTNDIVDLRPHKLVFEGSNYTVRGNPITLRAGISVLQQSGVVYLGITNSAPQTYNVMNSGAWLSVLGDIHLGTNTLTVDSIGIVYLVGGVSGTGGLIKNGSGTNRLTGSVGNSYTGTTVVNAGTLELDKSSGLAIAGPLVVGNGGNGTNSGAILRLQASNLIGGVPVTINDGALWQMNNNSDGIGSLTLKGGQVVTGTGHLCLGGSVTNLASTFPGIFLGNLYLCGTTRSFEVAANSELLITGTIADAGASSGVTKTGGGLLRFYNCANIYTGPTTIHEGILQVQSPTALGSSTSGTILAGGDLILEGASIANEWLTNNSPYSSLKVVSSFDSNVSDWAGNIVLNEDLRVIVSPNQTLYLDGIISGTGGFTKSQVGTLVLRGSGNTYTGTTTVRDAGLVLKKSTGEAIPGPLVIGPGSSPFVLFQAANQIGNVPVTVYSGGTLDLSGYSDAIGALTLNGGYVSSGSGLLTLGGDVTASGPSDSHLNNIYGNLSLGAATRAFNLPTANDGMVIQSVISGTSVGIVKTGSGLLRLSGANTFSGWTTVNEGTLAVAHKDALGMFGSPTKLAGGSLQLEGVIIANETIQNDSPNSSLIALGASGSSVDVVLNADLNVQVLPASTLDLSGTVSGAAGIIKSKPGTLIFSGTPANTYTGVTRVNEGTLVLRKLMTESSIHGPMIIGDGVGAVSSDIVRIENYSYQIAKVPVIINSSGLLDLNGRAETLGSLTGNGNVALRNGILFAGNDNSSTTFSGVIAGPGTFDKQGTGTLTLEASHSSSLYTTVESGMLIVNGSQPYNTVFVRGNPVSRTLGGSGTVGSVSGTDGAILSPGSSANRVGVLTTFDLTLNPAWTFAAELNGTTPGAGYDQVNVVGPVNLANATLKVTLGFSSAISNTFTIINNDANDPIAGTFNGLPEGATLDIGGDQFRISYIGGTGNDVVLTQLTATTPTPALTIERISGTQVRVSWPTNLAGYTLQSTSNLSTNIWSAVAQPPIVIGTNHVITSSATEPQMFFRLKTP